MSELGVSNRIPLSRAYINLAEIKGDIVSAVLFLPIAVMFQNLAESILCPANCCVVSVKALLLLFVILFVCIIEVLSITMVLISWIGVSRTHVMLIGCSTLIFLVAITVMGYDDTKNVTFAGAFVMSMLTAFWGLLLFNWDEESELMQVVMNIGAFIIPVLMCIL